MSLPLRGYTVILVIRYQLYLLFRYHQDHDALLLIIAWQLARFVSMLLPQLLPRSRMSHKQNIYHMNSKKKKEKKYALHLVGVIRNRNKNHISKRRKWFHILLLATAYRWDGRVCAPTRVPALATNSTYFATKAIYLRWLNSYSVGVSFLVFSRSYLWLLDLSQTPCCIFSSLKSTSCPCKVLPRLAS